jgi:hypothetical protein
MKPTNSIARTGLVLAACLSGWSLANSATLSEIPQVTATTVSSFEDPIESSRLDSYRGGFDLVKNDMKLIGSVANNTAEHVWSGNNVIADGAFSNASGFPMVVQNSGSNVLIQNATIVNVQLK